MPAGDNGGGQLNLIMFELGMITRDPLGLLPDLVQTVAVHPLVVVPASIDYIDTTRSTVQETHDGAILTKAGRALRQISFTGTFGVQSRGLGLYIGTGDLRFKRFYHEIVRLSDAITNDQVNAEKDLFRSPLLSFSLIPYDEDRTTFYVNFYDFWHDVKCEVEVTSFRFSKRARGGAAATGLTWYTLQVKEAGPIVTGGLGTALISGLFDALTAWDSLNEIIKSYTLDVIATSLVDAGGIVVGQFVDSVNAFRAQVDGATALINGNARPFESVRVTTQNAFGGDSATRIPTSAEQARKEAAAASFGAESRTGLSPYLGSSARISSSATDLLDTLRATSSTTLDDEGGAIRWGAVSGEGSIAALDNVDAQDGLGAVIDAAKFQPAAGRLYGMSREEFAAYLAATGAAGRPASLAGTVQYTVTGWDTVQSITTRFGVQWETILRLNDLLPDEALLAGTKLLIPRERPVGQPSRIAGLPVFGSHAGQAALGADLFGDFRCDSRGALAILSGPDLLVQGVDWMLALFEAELIQLANESPPVVQQTVVQQRIAAILATDKRIASVDSVVTDVGADGSLSAAVTLTAINGSTLQTGAAVQ